MNKLILVLLIVLPGISSSAVSAYYLIPEWVALDASYRNYQKLVQSPSATLKDLEIASAAENRHRMCDSLLLRASRN